MAEQTRPMGKKEKTYCTYSVFDISTQKIIYVGMTSDLGKRKSQHKKSIWWKDGLRFDTIDSNIASIEAAREREKYWIQKYTQEGHALQNYVNNDFSPFEQYTAQKHHEEMLKQYAHLSQDDAELMVTMIKRGEREFGGWAWQDRFEVASAVLWYLAKDGVIPAMNEIETAKLTYRLFGKSWEDMER